MAELPWVPYLRSFAECSSSSDYLGTPEKANRKPDPGLGEEGGVGSSEGGYPMGSDSANSSLQILLSSIQRQPGHCETHSHAKIVTKKRRRSLLIFSAHITRNAIEIEFSAPLGNRALIKSREYLRFPEPKHPSTSFRLLWSALSCCL